MNISLKTVKITALGLAVVIAVLLGVLVFWSPAEGPTKVPEISVTMPKAGDMITSPAGIEGQALGNWFFEASFPIKILDGDGTVLGQGHAQALGDWMTTGTVAFSASIPFTAAHYATGTVLFTNDNPSGDPANQKRFGVEVKFK